MWAVSRPLGQNPSIFEFCPGHPTGTKRLTVNTSLPSLDNPTASRPALAGKVVDTFTPAATRAARLVYGYPSLFKYAIDPGRPIRISVQNGHVTLYGSVDSEADRDIANIRANGA